MDYITDAVYHSQGQARLGSPDRTRLSDPCYKLDLEVLGAGQADLGKKNSHTGMNGLGLCTPILSLLKGLSPSVLQPVFVPVPKARATPHH